MSERLHRIEFRASIEEKAELDRKARIAGIPLATYARATALGTPMPARSTRIEVEAIAALNRLGVNLNQIAKSANGRGLTPPQVQALGTLGRKINGAVSEIKGLIQ